MFFSLFSSHIAWKSEDLVLLAFDLVIDLGLVEVVKYLLKNVPSVLHEYRDSAVYVCAKKNQFEIARLLAEAEFPINISCKSLKHGKAFNAS